MKHSSLYATVAAAICMATVSTPSLAATLCVTRQTETSLTFTFADFGGLDHELFVAHGATDGGDDKYAWDSFEKVADIAGDQTTYEYEVPAALRDGRPLRFFLMQTVGVNMAKEYTSIRSTGAQWIDTGVAPANNWAVDFRFKTPATFVNDTTFFGRGYAGKQYLFIFQNDGGTKFRFYGSSNYTVSTPVANTDYRLVIDPASILTLTGGGSETCKSVDRSINGSGNFAIFGANTGARLGTFTFYRMKIGGSSGSKVRDFIPAVNASGDIGLYDQVNNVFYPNQTTTPFVAGAERPAARFGRVMDETPTFRFPRSVSVASATADAVTLAFANPDGSAYKLYVAYGTTDCETRKNAWTSWEEVATIAADATSYTYTLPAALKADGVFYRFFLVKTDNLPYASEIASVTSTGAQTVRLDYVPGTDTTTELRFGGVTYEHQKTFFGQGWAGSCYLFNMQAVSGSDSTPSFRFHGGGTASTTVRPAANTDYLCRITAANKFLLDGGGASSEIPESRVSYAYSDLCVFASYGCGFAAKYRFDSMVVKDGDVVVRDLVPVQTTAGKGALFDNASGRVFENPTGTDFTKGAAVARQGWVISTTLTYAGAASDAPTIATPLDSITLTEDTEWSAIADRLVDAATVNLNGFELHAADYAAFLAKHPALAGTGNLRVTVPSGTTLTFNNSNKPIFTGKLIKDGAGTMVLSASMTHLTGVTVAEGIMKHGATSVFSNNGKTIEVLDGAAFDFNGNGNGNAVYYKIAGSGPDGLGALRNTGADGTNGQAQMSGLELTADALIRGTASFGMINASYNTSALVLNNHTLTLDMPSGKTFWIATANSSSAGTVYVKSGTFYPLRNDKVLSLPNVDVVIDGSSAVFKSASDSSKTGTFKSITVKNGGKMDNISNKMHMKEFTALDGALVPNSGIAWIYVANKVVVSNETTDITIYPPICAEGTYSKLFKYGAGTLYIKNNHTDQQMNSGAEIFGGTVVMDSFASTRKPEIAISSAAVPVTIHAGGTLDMRLCTNTTPFKVTRLVVEDGGTLLHAANNNLSIAGAATYDKPLPFGAFAGSLEIAAAVTFDLTELYSGASAPAAGADVTLFSAGTLTRASAGMVNVVGCPYDNYVTYESGSVVLHTASAAVAELNPIKIWNVGGTYVYGANNNSYRAQLGALLAAEGWKVEMTGWRTSSASIICNAKDAWKRHAGVVDLALKTSATRAGILEGLETYCAAANYPDFTIFLCGDIDVADGVADATVLANYKSAVTRIKAALPMTTVIACTIPNGSAALNADIASWCATETDVECVDIAGTITTAQTDAECNAVAAAIKAKLVTLATAAGKNTPSSWTPPAVVLDATNNVPAAYLAGFTRVRTIELNQSIGFPQNVYQIPYSYAPAMQETDIAKAGYYIELVRKDTGALRALWVDMDAPGSTWADVALPVTHAQRKQVTVTKLHVWSNCGGVSQVAANDDTVDGYLEFNPVNYSQTERTGDVVAEPWSGAFGFNDTLTTSGASGHACFQIMRKFSEANAFPAAEILFAFNRWGTSSGRLRGLGIGTLADYGNHGYNTAKSLDWTYTYSDTATADANTISEGAYSYIRIEFWVKYAEEPTRAGIANYLWTGATDATFNTVGNWSKDETVATSLANASVLLPAGASQSFTYVGWDPISLSTTTLMVDGQATFPTVGGFYLYGLDMGATGKIIFDPVKFSFRLVTPPVFAPGAKIALTPNYATATKGRFLLMTWDRGALEMDAAALNDLFDTTSANGADVKVWAENLASGGRLWLDLNYSAPKERINVFCTGDSITQGSNSTYGNWRVFLMKRLAAAGYAPVAKGHWKVESNDICGAVMPEEWVWHSGISGQRLVTKGGGGTIDAIDAMLDCAGDVDFVLAKICTNDINSNGSTAEELFPVWTNLVWKTLNRKPHAKFIAGAVVDIAYDAAKDAKVVAFNAAMSNAIANATFPTKRAYFADLYTPCYRYSVPGDTSTYITGSFYANNNLHPDWPGEDMMAETYCNAILGAIADDPGFVLGAAETVTETTSGIENNVPAAYLDGMTRARVFDIAANGGTALTSLGYVPYAYVNDAAPTNNLSRVGYYIELKRKDTDLDDYHDLTRWIWVSIDAFGDRTLADNGIPLTTINQCVVNRLRVISNMPGIESTAADENNVRGWVEFWPSQYNTDPSGLLDAPAKTFRCDWNDKRSDNMTGYGTMQVHRFTPGEVNPAQVMFAFNRWTGSDCYEIGIGNFSHNGKAIDQTWMGDANTRERNTSLAYEVAKIEIWTASDTPDGAAFVLVDEVSPSGGGEATVTGEVRDFGEGASSATLTLEWSTDPAFATVAGSTNIGVVAETGAVSATATGLTAGQTWYFRFTSVNSANVSATSGVSDPLDYSEGVWRPQTASDVWTSVAWQKNGEGSPVAFNPAWTAKFDGNEATPVASVQVPELVSANQVTVDASANYTLTGAGAIESKRLVKKGTGTLTLGAGVLAETPDIEIEGGTVKLADDATQGAAGRNGGTITVKNGGQFDLNYNDTASGNGRARALVTSGKKFVLEGAGPDGDGALVSTFANTAYGSPIDEIELTGDTTIGGVSRIDIRGNPKNRITGPTNVTLTVKTRPTSDYGLGLVGGSISVGKLNVAPEGKFKIEGATAINIPYGIDLYGMFMFYTGSGTWSTGGITAMGTAGSIGNASGDAYVRTPVTIPSDAKLTLNGGATTHYTDVVTNRNEISVANGNHYIEGPLVNEGNPVIKTGRTMYIYPSTVTGDSRIEASGGQTWLSGRSDWGDAALNVTLTGSGSLVIGANSDGYGMPKFGKNKLSATVASGHTGTVFFHPSTSASIDGLTCSGPVNNFYMQGPNVKTLDAGPVIAGHANDVVFTVNYLEVGNGNGRGEWTVTGENSHIVATTLSANWIGSHYYAGSLTFRDGLLEVGSGGIREAWTDPTRTVFNMESGTLRATANFNIGKAGMRATFGSPKKDGAVTFDLNGKTVKWGTGLTGASDVTLTGAGTFAPDRAGIQGIPLGKWTVNSTGTVDLRNAAGFAGGLALAENVTVKLDIAGTNMVEFLAWTWSGNAWNDLRPRYLAQQPITPFVATSLTYLNRAASATVDVKYGNGSGYNYMGEFYVSADQVGTWSFNYKARTHLGVFIDDNELSTTGPDAEGTVSKELTEGWHRFMISMYTGAANANVGSHSDKAPDCIKFKVGSGGTYQVFDSTTVSMRMRQHLGARTSVRWRKYAAYGDSASVYADADESKYTTLDVVTNSLQVLNLNNPNTGANAPLGGCAARFDGYFKVTAENAGNWTFKGQFDDRIALFVDGRRLFATTAWDATGQGAITLREGWHHFEIRTADASASGSTSGKSGASKITEDGQLCAVAFKVGSGSFKPFDERYLPIAYTAGDAQKFEEPGLGGEIELAAGSILTNDVRSGGWCPIYGTLKGSGTLAGPYRFTGESNSWEVTGRDSARTFACVNFANPTKETFTGLKAINAMFTGKPTSSVYYLTGEVTDLTDTDIAGVAYTVTDEAGNDYSANFALTVKGNRIALVNTKPAKFLIIVR